MPSNNFQKIRDAELIAVISPTPGHASTFAERFNIPNHFTELDAMLAMDKIDMVVLGAPNHLHCEITLKVAAAGKHIVVEKPFCLNMAEADRMIEACNKAEVKLMYAEESWTKPGGMDDRAEIHGTEGVAYADVLQGNSIQTYSNKGVGYAVEKAGNTMGWSYTMYEENWNYGFPQEMEHFVDCVKNDREPLVTGEDGKAVMEIIFAAYESAGTGRKVQLPFKTDAAKPNDLWKR